MRYLLDTDTCISILRGVEATIARLRAESPDDCRISVVTAYELYAGAGKSRAPAKERAKLERFFAVVTPVPFDQSSALAAGTIRAELETAGTPIGPYDLLIAGQAQAAGFNLVTGNTREFQRVKGLSVETWG